MLSLELSLRVISQTSASSALESREKYEQMKQSVEQLEVTIATSKASLEKTEQEVDQEAFQYTSEQLRQRVADLTALLAQTQKEKDALEQQQKDAEKRKDRTLLTEAETEKLRKQLADLIQEEKRLQKEIKALEQETLKWKKPSGLYFGRSLNKTDFPWLVLIEGKGISVQSLARETDRKFQFPGDPDDVMKKFLKWTEKQDRGREYFLFVIRPSGAKCYFTLLKEIDSSWRFGVNLIGETEPVEIEGDNTKEEQ